MERLKLSEYVIVRSGIIGSIDTVVILERFGIGLGDLSFET